jgi:hypothetical protein
LKPAPWNPRYAEDPEFLWRRPLLARPDGEIYAGNQRYRAAEHLGYEALPTILDDVSEQTAKERALRDNNNAGSYIEAELPAFLDDLHAQGTDLDTLGFDPIDLEWHTGGQGQSGTGGPSEPRKLERDALVRVALYPVDVALMERAIGITGRKNRGEALTEIFRAYLGGDSLAEGQFDIPV